MHLASGIQSQVVPACTHGQSVSTTGQPSALLMHPHCIASYDRSAVANCRSWWLLAKEINAV